MSTATPRPMMTAPDVCLHCGHLLVRGGEGIQHRATTPCREPRSCEPRERELRWDEWRADPQWARSVGGGGAPHIIRYGTPGVAVCGALVGTTLRRSRAYGCRACRNAWSHIDYAWRYERHWKQPYGGSGIVALAEAVGLWGNELIRGQDAITGGGNG